MSMHIGAKLGDIAENILLPGDPLRAKYIAQTYLDKAVCFNEIRGMYGYTGLYKGKPLSVMGTGMGIPAMLIYCTELMRDYGCKRLVRIGTAGAFVPELHVMDIVLSTATCTNSAMNLYDFPGTYAPAADFGLLRKAYDLAVSRGIPVHAGLTLCSDHFYYDNKVEYMKQWTKYGVLVSEMEGAALYTLAPKFGGKALTILNVGSNMLTGESVGPEVKEKGMDDMITLALDTVMDD